MCSRLVYVSFFLFGSVVGGSLWVALCVCVLVGQQKVKNPYVYTLFLTINNKHLSLIFCLFFEKKMASPTSDKNCDNVITLSTVPDKSTVKELFLEILEQPASVSQTSQSK